MESTKGKMNMHFETIANDQTCNADLRMPTVNTHCIITPRCTHPSAVALNPPTSPTATPTTPAYGDDETTWVDDGAQPGQIHIWKY